MKAVLISIQPKWCELIANGKKLVEVRKTKPKLETPFKCYIYCTNNGGTLHSAYDGLHYHESYIGKEDSSCINGKVIGEFVCDRIIDSFLNNNDGWFVELGCLTPKEINEYQGDKAILYGWHISDLVIYEKPRELGEFKPYNRKCYHSDLGLAIPKCKDCHDCYVERPPQSWCYVDTIPQNY